ncbi:MAG: OB-fold nucleic acid binding domain-containing protein [Thermomicrobiales bacterium]
MAEAYRILGLSPHVHPLGLLRSKLPAGYATSADLERLPDGAAVRLAGRVVCRQRPGTAKGVTILLVEDELGLVNAIVSPTLYERRRDVVRGESFVVLMGRLQKRGGVINLLVRAIVPLDVPCLLAQVAAIDVPDAARVAPASHNYR